MEEGRKIRRRGFDRRQWVKLSAIGDLAYPAPGPHRPLSDRTARHAIWGLLLASLSLQLRWIVCTSKGEAQSITGKQRAITSRSLTIRFGRLWAGIQRERVHGGMDYIEDYRLIQCLREGSPTDMDVYDAAALS